MKQPSDLGRWARLRLFGAALAASCLLCACDGTSETNPPTPSPNAAAELAACDSSEVRQVLSAVPAAPSVPIGKSTVRIHYHRNDGRYEGWRVYAYNAPGDGLGAWPGGVSSGSDGYGPYWDVPVAAAAFNFILHGSDGSREPSAWPGKSGTDEQQHWSLSAGTEIWKLAGDATQYRSNPLHRAPLDIHTLRVHYQRYDGHYANWGLHLWNGLDAARLPGVATGDWDKPARFDAMPAYRQGAGEVVFDIPVLNPKLDAARKSIEFIIHGTAANPNGGTANKDGRSDNIKVDYASLSIKEGVGDIWLVQEDAAVHLAAPDNRSVSSSDARAYWLSRSLLQWPRVDGGGVFKLYYSRRGQLQVAKESAVSGADGALTLLAGGSVPAEVAKRFKFVAPGVVLTVQADDQAKLAALHADQLVLVQEDAAGKVRNATTAQLAGALDDQFAAAAAEASLGVAVAEGRTQFKLWAPTAQKVSVCRYDSGSGKASAVEPMQRDAVSGIWTLAKAGDLSGSYYNYLAEVFVRGVGVVRNRVTDPYSISLTTDSKRSYVAALESAALKPAGWDGDRTPATAPDQVDMSIYELHVRDFSANDGSVSPANRGKYLAFTENSDGMRHLSALAKAGLTDIHLMPVFDLATVPEAGCRSPAIADAAADSETQQAAVAALREADCYNWGYDPYHYSAPEGSYASDAADGAKRIVEFRRMVQALHQAGLRVGMDVVYNHTSAAGQHAQSVLDRLVPGYYQRLNAAGEVETSTCCANTATENTMMAKLMIDSVKSWTRHYHIDSFRFDLMAHQPRAVMERLRTAVDAVAGRRIHLVGEGWNFGEVADGARFEQASQLSLNGSGIATFSDRARDYARGGGPFDGGTDLVRNQGYLNGLFYDDNGAGGDSSRAKLLWAGDVIKAGLAGSIRGFVLTTGQDESKPLAALDYGGQPVGYVAQPQEVVNYVENHDNQTLFDINAYKLPLGTSRLDRARVQMLGAALTSFSQGVGYFHAGIDTLRSKSMDRNSFNAGDWFNRLDWRYQDNYFGSGAPGKDDNGANYAVLKPLLSNPAIKPTASEIGYARDAFRDLLAIRTSSALFRLRSAEEIKRCLRFLNTGSSQVATVVAGHLDGGLCAEGANFRELLYFINVDKVERTLSLPGEAGKAYRLHPVQAAATAADQRLRDAAASACNNGGSFRLPPRTAVVCVVPN
ncbi:pullulanase-type alpha-1,6-glucosidase [Chitinimonas arctica]|uniref:pullulanase n=1 Tax=Chitinimonas arctica TaxID=2594795 RepID=A0A516SIQ8_9NEIS|nr:pullulanase-type alpha-1,6-glucosidase [Chitinimonas arctica]QDQ28023.1 pullulanase-type alpha-1,6-glucosidase [Chitinimonas arctica]